MAESIISTTEPATVPEVIDIVDLSMMSALVTEVSKERASSDEQLLDQVQFVNVRTTYPPNENIELAYSVGECVVTTAHDWVGVYKVGWKSPKSDYYTFVWATPAAVENGERTVTFTPRYLPTTDQSSYQFCYVTKSGEIRGVSSPFQIKTDFSEEDLVCVDEESDLVLVESRDRRRRELALDLARELHTEERISELEAALADMQVAEKQWQVVRDEMCQEKSQSMVERSEAEGTLVAMRASIDEHLAEIEALKVAKQRAVEDAAQTAFMVTEIEAKLSGVVEELNTTASQVSEAKSEHERLTQEHAEQAATAERLRQQLSTAVADLSRTSAELRGTRAALELEENENEHLTEVFHQQRTAVAELTRRNEELKADGERLEAALRMANERKFDDDRRLEERQRDLDELRAQLAGIVGAHFADATAMFKENGCLKDEAEAQLRRIEDLQGELMAVSISLEETRDANRRLQQRDTSSADVMQQNMMELIGENQLLRSSAAEREGELSAAKAELAASTAALSEERDNTAAMFGLKKAYDDERAKCELAVAAQRQQSRLARAAEATVALLEGEIQGHQQSNRALKEKVREGAEYYRVKFLECAELTRRLRDVALPGHGYDDLEDDEADDVVLENNVRRKLMESRTLCIDLKQELVEQGERMRTVEVENERLRLASCQLLQSIPPQPSAGLAVHDSSEEGSDPDASVARRCPVCGLSLPWTMAIEAVQQHCASHFNDN